MIFSTTTMAAASEPSSDFNPTLSAHNGAFQLENDKRGAGKEVMHSFTHDRGAIVSSHANTPYFVKYQGLGNSQGLPSAVVVEGSKVFLTWVPPVGLNQTRIDIIGDLSLHVELSGLSKYELQAHPGAEIDVSIIAVKPAAGPNDTTHAEWSEIPIAVPVAATYSATSLAATAVTLPAKTLFRQNAFIPDAYLQIPLVVNGPCTPLGSLDQYRFVGDNRGFSPNDGASFRTRMDVTLTWGGTIPSAAFTRLVGTTRREIQLLDGSWQLDAANTASNSSMTLNILSSTSTYSRFKLTQDVVNPFCDSNFTNGIASTTTVTVYRSGAVSGTLDWLAMPSYEIYLRQDTGNFVPLAQFGNLGWPCLVKGSGALLCGQTTTLRN